MTDFMSPEQRSKAMAKVRGGDTRIERELRALLHRSGFRFRKNVRQLPGCPDIVFPRYRAVIFVHGCFWHQHPGCAKSTIPRTRSEFWLNKLRGNQERDSRAINELSDMGWRVAVIWECQLKDNVSKTTILNRTIEWLLSDNMKCLCF